MRRLSWHAKSIITLIRLIRMVMFGCRAERRNIERLSLALVAKRRRYLAEPVCATRALTRHDDPPNARATFLVPKSNNGKMMPLYGVKSMLLFDSKRCKNGT